MIKKLKAKGIYKLLLAVGFFVGIYFLLTYKLTQVPPGINFDEASIGYNAALISKSLHDENDRFLPVFILTLDGKDWKQPINVYLSALIFRILGKSYFNLRLLSVIYALISGFVFYKILRLFFPFSLSAGGLLLFFSSPSIMIQSHLILENIAMLPFFLIWLYFLLSFSLAPKNWKLLVAGISLGISFYAYKGMRAMVPVYLAVSAAYLLYLAYLTYSGLQKKPKLFSFSSLSSRLKPLIIFLIGVGPFILPSWWLNTRYAGAVYDPAVFTKSSIFESSLIYFANFDFSFLFAKGDSMLTHSTGRHGIFLGPTFFLLFFGLFQIAKERKREYNLILISLVLTPILLMTVGSSYRASRLMMYIPLVTFIFVLGIKKIWEYKNIYFRWILLSAVIVSVSAAYADFLQNYFGPYPKRISADFSPNFDRAFGELAKLSKETGKDPYMDYDDFQTHKSAAQFFREVYFSEVELKTWPSDLDPFPENGLVLTRIAGSKEIYNFKEIPSLQSGQQTFYVTGKK